MKNLFVLSIIAGLIGMCSIVVEAESTSPANAASNASEYQIPIEQILLGRHHHHRRWNNRNNNNVSYETRTVYKGHKVYRDTYRITYKNGHEKSKRISHVRVG